ncbi:hypothetical protein Vadar_005718 [Vaccinium darrowii]|uniref:Uncharacterized protein n=1 Tax=Vaccinium darrowii TaxID=229202 RepID=A0ACB7XP96_9ERIC|nr:hypothetical protein Vadar_005718 [Vaccinium darrowii]
MEIIGRSSPVTTASLSSQLSNLGTCFGFSVKRSSFLVSSSNGYFSLSPFSSQNISLRLRKSVISAAKKDNKRIEKKPNTHSFIVKPDEAGFFPEAVLLKEEKVQEDGRLLPEFADDEERELYEQLHLELESKLNLEQMRHYEVVYMIHEDHVKEVESVNSKVQEFIKEKKGRVWRFSDWGVRQLAYKIKKATRAHYILMNFEVEAKSINDLKNMLDKDERVIRHLVIKRDKAETKKCPPPPEFHTLFADMDDDDDDDDEDDDEDDTNDDEEDDMDETYDDEDEDVDDTYDGEEVVDGGEEDMDGDDNDIKGEEGIVYVEDYIAGSPAALERLSDLSTRKTYKKKFKLVKHEKDMLAFPSWIHNLTSEEDDERRRMRFVVRH